jgi:hypothetical protein
VTRPDPAVSGGCKAERIDRDDEQLLRRRVYAADHDHPGPRWDRRYVELGLGEV